MESNAFRIYLWNNFVVIENIQAKKRVSIEKNTLKLQQDFPSLNETMKDSKIFPTKGILGITQFNNQHCLLYILKNKVVGKLNNSEIYQINEISFIPLSNKIENSETLSMMLDAFSSMIKKGFFYYSLSYDLTNTYLAQRNYLYYKTCRHDYLWNDDLLDRFNKANIEIEQFIVFAICGFVQCYNNPVNGKGIQLALISRKKHVNYKANNTQLETIILYSNISVFTYLIKSFNYEHDINKSKENILDLFQQQYSQYNSIKRSAKSQTIAYGHPSKENGTNMNMVIHILDKNHQTEMDLNIKAKLDEMSAIIAEAFDKQQYIQFNYNHNHSSFKAFVSGIQNLILNSQYSLITKKSENDLLGFDIDEPFFMKKSFLQKTYAIIISYDEKPIIEFQKYLLWEVIKGYFKQYHISPLPVLNKSNSTQSKQESKKSKIFGVNDDGNFGSGAQFQNICLKNIEEAFTLYSNQIAIKDNKKDYTAMDLFFQKDHLTNLLNSIMIKNKESQMNKLNIFISTWNVGAIKDISDIDLYELFFPKTHMSVITNNCPHIYGIALQEIVKLSTKKVLFESNDEMVAMWISKVEAYLPGYKYIKHISLVGLLLLLFVSESHSHQVTYVNDQVIKTGFFGTLGNKGSCCVTLSYLNKQISFSAVHLASGNENNSNRMKDLTGIVKSAPDANSRHFYDNDHWFVFGDFNFRLNMDNSNIKMLLEAKYYENLKANDQLISNKNKFDFDYMEEEIKFKPTYKFFVGNNNYNTKRTPSWCDRILFKRSSNIKPLIYDKCELLFSDHKPVIGLFQIFI